MPTLADRLRDSHQRNFVGREAQCALFSEALDADVPPFTLLHIHGPGGIGKSSLQRQFAYLARQAGVLTATVNGAEIDATANAFLAALRRSLVAAGREVGPDAVAHLAAIQQRHVLLIDTFEAIAGLESWLRDELLPQLSAEIIIVICDRNPLSAQWRLHPGWQPFIHTIGLRNLPPQSAKQYLTQQGIPADEHAAVLDFTHGHPLGLALVAATFAQRQEGFTFDPQSATPDIVKTLVERFIAEVPGQAHRAALDMAGLVRTTQEALLAAVLDLPDAHGLFEWLRSLSFIETLSSGVAPHALAREALAADLKWRNPDWHRELNDRVRRYYREQLQAASGAQQQRILVDYIYLHQHNPIVQPFFNQFREQAAGGYASIGTARADEQAALAAMVAQHEGMDSAELFRHWFDAQPHNTQVYRDADGQPVGLFQLVDLDRASAAQRDADPATATAWRYLETNAPLRPGEHAIYIRAWLDHAAHQNFSPIQASVFVTAVRHYLTTPNLAVSFFATATAPFYAPLFQYADIPLLPDVGFSVGERTFGVFWHDWRRVPPMQWLDLLAARENQRPSQAAAPAAPRPTVLVLSRDEFDEALREAIGDYTRPDRLGNNLLMRSNLVLAANADDKVAHLQQLIADSAELLKQDPRSLKYYRAFYHAYLQPAPTHEAAAELIDVPYGSFRRHLKRAVTHVSDVLWQREIG